MATAPTKPKWTEIGRSTTTPTKNKIRKEIQLDEYYVVVGFEVNLPNAFTHETQDLAIDYGHAFFYLVKNTQVAKLFSFGPNGPGKVGWFNAGNHDSPNKYNRGALIKDGYKNARPGTPDYAISETIKVFKLPLSIVQGKKLEVETEKMRAKISKGEQKYTAYINDTCAETSRDVLTSAGINTPSGSGKIKHSGVVNLVVAYAVNPYMWHENFKKQYKEVVFSPPEGDWMPKIGKKDPIF